MVFKSRMAAVLALTAFLTGTGFPVFAGDKPPIKTIAVISDLGDQFTVKHVGFMVFSNSEGRIDVSDWKTDDYVNSLIAKALTPTFELKGVSFEKGSIASDKQGTFFTRKDTGDLVRDNAKPTNGQPVDAYLVVAPFGHDVGLTNQIVQGLGFLTWGSSADIYSAIGFYLIDGNSFSRIDFCHPEAPDDEQGRERDMWKHPEFAVEKANDVSPEMMPKLESATKHALEQGIAFCLRDMKLIP
ncbi:MAG: hypothetical protein ABL973_04975 [Micropepsaceae bacterium]